MIQTKMLITRSMAPGHCRSQATGRDPIKLQTCDDSVLSIEGAFDALSAPKVRGALDAVVAEQRPEVAVDLSQLTSIDSSGIGAVVSLYKRVRAQGGRVHVRGLRGQPLAIFRLLQ